MEEIYLEPGENNYRDKYLGIKEKSRYAHNCKDLNKWLEKGENRTEFALNNGP